jgi:ABC-type branched-subunit amino acid transport system permease subunit
VSGLLPLAAAVAALAAVPLLSPPDYVMHLLITALLTALAGTGWAMMGRFGLVSFGHGAFLGVSAYTMALLWNFFGLSPWIGVPIGVVAAAGAGALLGYPCFRLRVVGHYFALVTLAAGEIVRILVTALREYTGGSLGMTPNQAPPGRASPPCSSTRPASGGSRSRRGRSGCSLGACSIAPCRPRRWWPSRRTRTRPPLSASK